jgi:hypothetical protein
MLPGDLALRFPPRTTESKGSSAEVGMDQRVFIPEKRESNASTLNSKNFRCSLVCICDSQQSGPYRQGSSQQNHFEKIRILFSISDCSRSAERGFWNALFKSEPIVVGTNATFSEMS